MKACSCVRTAVSYKDLIQCLNSSVFILSLDFGLVRVTPRRHHGILKKKLNIFTLAYQLRISVAK